VTAFDFSIRTKLKLMALAIVGLTALLGLYGYFLLDGNARKASGLETGVLRHSDVVADFQNKTLGSMSDLYRLTAIASNESDTGKIEAMARGGYRNPEAEQHPATAHLFIINPLGGRPGDNLFATHPATENRVAALMELAGRTPRTRSATSVPVTEPTRGPWGS